MTTNQPATAQLAADLTRLPADSLAALNNLRTAADAGDREAAATLTACLATAADLAAMTPDQRLEAHFARRNAELDAADRARGNR